MIQNDEKHYAKGWGKLPLIAAARFTPADGADPTIVHSCGIETITWASEGKWTCTLSNNALDVLASGFPFAQVAIFAQAITSGDTRAHFMSVSSINEAAGTFQVTHIMSDDLATPVFSLDDVAELAGVCVFVYALEA